MTRVIAKDELPYSTIAHKFEGYRYGDVNVSFFLLATRAGDEEFSVEHGFPLRLVAPGYRGYG